MAHGQHTTRRAFFKGAVAAIAVASVAGTEMAAAAAEPFPTPDMMRMAADGMLSVYRRYGVTFHPQPDGRIFRCMYAGEDNTYDHDAVASLDQRMKAHPDLHQAVMARVREIYSA